MTPDQCKIGIMPGNILQEGNSVASCRAPALLDYEAVFQTTNEGSGASPALSHRRPIRVKGTEFIDILDLYLRRSGNRNRSSDRRNRWFG